MTRQKTFKRRVRARMAKTGESYTAARRMLIANGDRPDVVNREFEPRVSEGKVREETGRGYQEWFSLLDEWGGTSHSHPEIARRLMDEHGVPGWYAQTLTVAYEQARGLREPGQKADGFEVTASKTVAVPAERLFEAFADESLRERWLPGAEMRLRTAKEPRTARFDWEDGSTRVIVGFDAIGDAKSRVSVAHARLPDSDTADEMKVWWRERVSALKQLLEGAEVGA